MAYTHVKTLQAVKEEGNSSTGSRTLTPVKSGAAMIETGLSVIILLVMSGVFKWINGKQREFDRLEDKHAK